jgi:hypothetical protein
LDENMAFEAYYELPDGYQVQLMVLRDYPIGQGRKGRKMSIFRSRVWVGHECQSEPMSYKSQEHTDLQVAIDACYSLVLISARGVIDSAAALDLLQQRVHTYFSGERQVM